MKNSAVELVFVPSPGAGHTVSMVEIAKAIAARDSSLSISVLVLKFPLDSGINATAESLSSSSARIKFVDLPQDNVDPADFTPLNFLRSYYESQKPHVRSAVEKILSAPESGRLAGFVVDMLCTAMTDVADEFGVPTYVFYTSGAGTLSLLFHLQSVSDRENDSCLEFPDEIVVPGFTNPVPEKVLPGLLLDKDAVPLFYDLYRKARKARGILVNTFAELESGAIEALASTSNIPPVYSVGPVMNLSPGDKHAGYGGTDKTAEIVSWLDRHPASSVVFLCFGSMGSFGGDQAREIATALERSGARFLWSLRRPPRRDESPFPSEYADPAEALPEGFLQRTAGVGKVIGWAPQAAVLAHPAVGGFVSHCGWNSILESVWFGVPVATWPLFAEQQVNAFQMARELGLAVEITVEYRKDFRSGSLVGDDSGDLIVRADEIEGGIRRLMERDSHARKRVKEMSVKSRSSLLDGCGSSHTSLSRFINDIF